MTRTPRERGGGGSPGGEPPDYTKARRAAAKSALVPTVSALSSMFRDVLRLLQLGLVHTFLLEGKCRDVEGIVSLDYGMGVLLSA